MAITKTGSLITKGIRGLGMALGGIGGKAMRFGMPMAMGAASAFDVASGERSLGEAVGDLAGGWAGWGLGSRMAKGLTKNMIRPGGGQKWYGKALNFAIPMAVSGAGASVASTMFDKAMPYRREKPSVDLSFSGDMGNQFDPYAQYH